MSDQILTLSDDFWNIRGDFKLAGLINIGTQASLVRRKNGKFLMLDAYTLEGDVKAEIDSLTDNGANLEAIVNLHPFHTVHVERAHQQYPEARLYGTRRHLEKFPELPWQPERTETPECAALFADDLEFSVPDGVDFIPDNENLHFSSVLAYHPASRTIHSDDTLMYLQLPAPLCWLKPAEISFHITLAKTLEKRPDAAADFRRWATQLADSWRDAENLCAAHSAAWLGREQGGESLSAQILAALEKVEPTLTRHAERYD